MEHVYILSILDLWNIMYLGCCVLILMLKEYYEGIDGQIMVPNAKGLGEGIWVV